MTLGANSHKADKVGNSQNSHTKIAIILCLSWTQGHHLNQDVCSRPAHKSLLSIWAAAQGIQECFGYKAWSSGSRCCLLLSPVTAALIYTLAGMAPKLAARLLAPCSLQEAECLLLKVLTKLCLPPHKIWLWSILLHIVFCSEDECVAAASEWTPLLGQGDCPFQVSRPIHVQQDSGEQHFLALFWCAFMPAWSGRHHISGAQTERGLCLEWHTLFSARHTHGKLSESQSMFIIAQISKIL